MVADVDLVLRSEHGRWKLLRFELASEDVDVEASKPAKPRAKPKTKSKTKTAR